MSDGVDEAAHSLLVASRALVAVAARSIAETGEVTLPQFRALVVLSQSDMMTVGDLAAALDIHASTATRLCDRLERKQLVERRAGGQPDRRATTVELSAKGRRLVGRVTERRRRDLAAIVASMTRQSRGRTIAALEDFSRAAAVLPGLEPFGWAADEGDTTT